MKSSLTKSFFLFFISTCFSSFSFGQVVGNNGNGPILTLGTITNNGGGNGDDELYFEDCESTILLTIPLANLQVIPFDPVDIIHLPLGVPPMFLRYSIDGGPLETVQLTTFTFWQNVNGTPVYLAIVESYPINICDRCEGDISSIEITFTSELLLGEQLLDGTAVPVDRLYPACSYNDFDEMFSCNVFIYAGDCDDGSTCRREELTTIDASIPVTCDADHRINEEDADTRNSNKFSNIESDFSADPNPFNTELIVHWPEDSKVQTISLFDTNGKLVQNWNQNELTSHTRLKINTNNLSKGLYFLKVSSFDETKVLKVVKQ